ncbi:sterol esterase Tgl1p [[Candida] anglica]|uniref:Sterol esterase Tgl1p n=1 Tax=[Candida] anglica TaxID=148631 RepID=A0ABP0EHR8_9ASCO
MAIPLLGRISIREWPLFIISLSLAWLEYVSSLITSLLPAPIIQIFTSGITLFYRFSAEPINLIKGVSDSDNISGTTTYKYLDSDTHGDVEDEKYHLMIDVLNAPDIQHMCSLFGYNIESHIVKTTDNYLLTLHHLVRPESHIPRNGKVIYLHHGLLMSSDIWVTMLERHLNLPYLLHDLGYDVWLGNNRGNKYSQKHLFYKTNSEKFWDFSLDEFALFDIPNTVDYILNSTSSKQLTYIGFSQGSAQCFASMSVNPELKDKIDQVIAISPATTPHGLYSKLLDILLKASPSLVYLIFSRRVLLPSVLLWQRLMYPPLFDSLIDASNYFLFNWKSLNIQKMQKIASYAHLYSPTSVKCVVHWFQVISSKKFQMFQDSDSMSGSNPIYYPLKNIKTPIHIIYGDSDSLVDIDVMKSQLPSDSTTVHRVHGHEHLDNIWGHDAKEEVFEHVIQYLGETSFNASNIKTKKSYLQFVTADEDYVRDGEEAVSGQASTVEDFVISHRKPSTGGSVFV